ncbi:hypothetical protein SDC9_197848 [bioreactor metagenome]|uniref:Uncharacterized protein n=1 Tax=bioreactor metagenome TaxID=1076179 RepID=A0A645IHA3_9ZZZZ
MLVFQILFQRYPNGTRSDDQLLQHATDLFAQPQRGQIGTKEHCVGENGV